MKKFLAIIVSFVLVLVAALSATPLMAAGAAGPNLIPNPSLEQNAASNPTSWASNTWGTNKAEFTYKTGDSYSGTYSVSTKMTSYRSGDAKWYFSPVTVSPNTTYTFSNWYKSNVKSTIDVEVTSADNKLSYIWLGDRASSSSTWVQSMYTFKTPANAAKITIYHSISAVGEVITDDYSLTTPTATTPTSPTVSLTAPSSGSTLSGTTTVSASVTDITPLAGVQFKLDGNNLDSEDLTAPYSISWDTKAVANGTYSLTAVARNTSGGTATSSPVNVTVNNAAAPTAPTVVISAPTNGTTVSGSVALSADASDAQSVSSVQFKIDGVNVSAADTTNPYSVNWDSTSAANGTHTVTAVATNASGMTTTSSPVTINLQNTVAPPPAPAPSSNLIANESVEDGTSAPTGWTGDGWGTNTRALSYETTGRTGTRSLKAAITSYTDGDAKWYFREVPVTAGKTYNYSNYYKSNVASELDAMVTMSNGAIQYFWLGSLPASTGDWQKASVQFAPPAGAVSMTIFQVISSVGYVQTDDFSLAEYQPQQFNRALVSLNFDDSWRSAYTNGFPLLQKYGFKSTQYLNSQPTMAGWTDYMTYQMVKDFANAGHELGWHTQTHSDISKMSTTTLDKELTIPSTFLKGTGLPASRFTNFASPYGAYNTSSVNQAMGKYRSHRSTDVGYNTKDNFSITNIRVQNITKTTTPAQVQAWVNQAKNDNSWLVLLYHEVSNTPADATYAVTPANLDAELNIIKQSGVIVKTMQQALDEITPQL